jgi:AcrR family transcriptional regulator
MPPKKRFTKEQILEAAFEIAKEEGISGITIRKVATRMGASIAPIYVNFNDVEQLTQEVIRKVVRISQQMIKEQRTGNPFLDVGMASLRFAREYTVLCKDLMFNHAYLQKEYEQEMAPILLEQMREDRDLEPFSDEERMYILLKMKIFHIGLTAMLATDLLPAELDEQSLIELLQSTGTDVIAAAHLRKEGKLEELGGGRNES